MRKKNSQTTGTPIFANRICQLYCSLEVTIPLAWPTEKGQRYGTVPLVSEARDTFLVPLRVDPILTLLHSERPKLYAILAFLNAIGSKSYLIQRNKQTFIQSDIKLFSEKRRAGGGGGGGIAFIIAGSFIRIKTVIICFLFQDTTLLH